MKSQLADFNPLFVVNQRRLEQRKFSSRKVVDRELTKEIKGELWDNLYYQLDAYIYSEYIGRYKQKVPLNWWEQAKQEIAPKWFRRLFPVKTRNLVLEAGALFPEYVPPAGIGGPVVYLSEVTHADISEYTKRSS